MNKILHLTKLNEKEKENKTKQKDSSEKKSNRGKGGYLLQVAPNVTVIMESIDNKIILINITIDAKLMYTS